MNADMRWPELGSREDADRTHKWARELTLMWEAEKVSLEAQLEAERARIADDIRYGNHGMGNVAGPHIRARIADIVANGGAS